MNDWIVFTIFYVTLLPMFLLSFTPYLTRKTENFGVTIPLELHERRDFQQMRERFMKRMLTWNSIHVIILIMVQWQFSISTFTYVYIISIIGLLIIFFMNYLPFHKKMKQIKRDEKWLFNKKQQMIIDTDFRKAQIVHHFSWYLIPFSLIIGTALYTIALYDVIPSEIPTHTSIDGNVTYSNKSPSVLMILPFTQLFLLAIMIGTHYAIKVAKQTINVANPVHSRNQNRTFRRYWSMFSILTSIGFVSLLSYMQLAMIHQTLFAYQNIIILVLIMLLILSLILLTIRTGQGGSRLTSSNNKQSNVIEVDEDKYWILGQIYFNRKDPTIFVEKRFGIGWTVNFARPITWILFLVLFIPLFIPLFL